MPELQLSEISLHFEVDGSGPPLLLLAGMFSDSATWAPLLPLLTQNFTVIRPDNRTTGRTKPKDAPAHCALMATNALELMQHLGHARFHVAGHSLGGLLSLELAHIAPDTIATATVLASGRVRSPRTASLFSTILKIRAAPEGEEMWLRALYPWLFGNTFFENPNRIEEALTASLAYPHAQSLDAMTRQVAAFHSFRPKAKMAEITCPTLILYAGQDLMIPPDHARPGFAKIPDLTEATIEHAGHSIVWDAPSEVAEHLTTFLHKNPM